MNRIKLTVLHFLLLFLFITTNDIHAQVTIGSGEKPENGALLDLNEGRKGTNGENSETKTAQITLIQEGMDYNADLSLPNCYIVSKADTRFTIPIKKAVADFGATIDAPGQRLNHTIKNPLDFMTTTATDWYFLYKLIGGDKTRLWSDRWGDIPSSSTNIGPKSVMDPCPEGWRVPYPTGSGLVQYSPWGETFNGSQTACTALTYGGNQYGFSYKEGSSTTQVYYPTTGQLSQETGQMQVDTGSESGSGNPRVVSPFTGTYWNSGGTIVGLGAMGEFKGNTLVIANPLKSATTGSGSSDGQFTEFRAAGAAVRCMKDTYNYNR